MLRVALEAEQANRLRLRQRDRLAEVEERLRLLHMLYGRCARSFRGPRRAPPRARASGCRVRASADSRSRLLRDAPRAGSWRSPSCGRPVLRECRARARRLPRARCGGRHRPCRLHSRWCRSLLAACGKHTPAAARGSDPAWAGTERRTKALRFSRRDIPGCGWRAGRADRACRSTAASSGTRRP